MCRKEILEIATMNGIRFTSMTNYRAELVHLRNENYTYKNIAIKINTMLNNNKVTDKNVEKWFTRESQPKDEIIEVLENWLQARVFTKSLKVRNPELNK